jgi:surface polysaccharide O-acyltransferase-like enzyme
MKQQRIVWLDAARVVAMLMVILMHSPIPGRNLSHSMLLGGLSYLTYPCIGLFFMTSGALLLPVKIPLKEFLNKRFSRIFFPTIIWSLFYIMVKLIYSDISYMDALKLVLFMPVKPVEGILWFMYTLIGLYLFAPILSKWLEVASKRQIEFFILLWMITTCFPYLNAFIDMQSSDYHILSTFSGFMGYMVLGYYLKTYPISLLKPVNVLYFIGLLILFAIVLPLVFYKIPIHNFDSATVLYNHLAINIVFMAVGWFSMIQHFSKIYENKHFSLVLKEFSTMSLGIYLAHIFVMRRLIWKWDFWQSLPLSIEIIAISITTFILTYLLIKLLSFLPFKKYIIG